MMAGGVELAPWRTAVDKYSEGHDKHPRTIDVGELQKQGISVFDEDLLEMPNDNQCKLLFQSLSKTARYHYLSSSTSELALLYQTWKTPRGVQETQQFRIGAEDIESRGGFDVLLRSVQRLPKRWQQDCFVAFCLDHASQEKIVPKLDKVRKEGKPYVPPGSMLKHV
ncbi:hypothetical protein ACFL6C_02955 [Myxococcota bacterium]